MNIEVNTGNPIVVPNGINRPNANFSQHDYDWNALELALLAQQ